MEKMKNLKLILLKFFVLNIVYCNSAKLNVPRVLLPIFSEFSVNFTLEDIDGGCYKWTTTRTDIIQLTPIDRNTDLMCSSKVVISTITKDACKNLAVVLAEDVNNIDVLKCDVIVDVISSLTIATTTRELFMEEIPEAFQVIAYDAQGNEFSSLEGIEFEWIITPVGPRKEASILRYLRFDDSSYETPQHIKLLEQQNKKGSMILLMGVRCGTAKISVHLPYPEYKKVKCDDITLTVIANLLLSPFDSYLMIGDYMEFHIFHVHGGKMEEISLPDDQYYISSENKEIAFTTNKSSHVTAMGFGDVKIQLHNRNIDQSDPAVKLPSTTVHVVKPSYMVLTVLPYRNWAILMGDYHEIQVEIFTVDDHKLYLGSGIEIKMQIQEDAFYVNAKSKNGSWLSGWGTRESSTLVQACLESVSNPTTGKLSIRKGITAQGDLFIYQRITILPSRSMMPWDPQSKPKYSISLVAKGGDGRFLWSSSDNALGIVSQNGNVRTLSGPGVFEVTASMLRNHNNRKSAEIAILPPDRMEIAEYLMETEVGETIYLHVALYAKNSDLPFTFCQDLPFTVTLSNNNFRYNKGAFIPPIGSSCGNIALIGLQTGTTKVTISYIQDNLLLENTITVTAFNRLRLFQPQKEIVLTVGSSINLIYTGGPHPINGRINDYKRVISTIDDNIITIVNKTAQYQHITDNNSIIWVLCKKLGEAIVKLWIYNIPPMPNCKSYISKIETKIICGKIRKIQLQPEFKIADVDSCPMDLSADRVIVQSNQDIEIDVTILDNYGRRFLNISSLLFQWSVRPKDKVKFELEQSIFERTLTYDTVNVSFKNYQIIKSLLGTGLIEITLTIDNYNTNILKKLKITPERPPFLSAGDKLNEPLSIYSTIGLYLVNNTYIEPNTTIIFNHPMNKKLAIIRQGSGYYKLTLSSDDIANVKYSDNNRVLEINPIKSGDLIIQVKDLCLNSQPVNLMVHVIFIGNIDVEMSDKIEINRGIICIVRLYDENNNLLPISEIGYIDLIYTFTNKIITIERTKINLKKLPKGEIHFIITGIEIGDTQLSFKISNGNLDSYSSPINLKVFPPLKLIPRNATLIIGSNFQITTIGGPQPDIQIEFLSTISDIVDVTQNGIVVGHKLGKTKIIGRSIGIHPNTGQKIIYSEDEIEVNVIKINGIKIATPLTRVRTSGVVPVWVWGIPDTITPMVLGSIEYPSVHYSWQIEDDSIISINGIFNTLGIHYEFEDRETQRIKGLQAGKTKLNVTVTMSNIVIGKKDGKIQFSSSIEIEVIEKITLDYKPVTAAIKGKSFLMAPNSQMKLLTNLDGREKIIYTINPPNGGSIIKGYSKNNLTNEMVCVTPDGMLYSNEKSGMTMLLISSTDNYGLTKSLYYIIEIKPVHYMMLVVNANWRIHLDNVLRVIPLGADFEFNVKYYDNYGRDFHIGPNNFKFRASRYDLIKVQHLDKNESVIINTKKPGHSVFKVWSEQCSDYAKIHVEQVIKPYLEHLTSGDIICLWSPIIDTEMQPGIWLSSDENMVMIDSNLNIAFVIGNREGLVTITNSLQPSAPLHLQVTPVVKVILHPDLNTLPITSDGVQFLTNGPAGTIFTIPLSLHGAFSRKRKTSNLIQGWRCQNELINNINPTPFDCFISFTNESNLVDATTLYTVESIFIHKTGQYACKLLATGNLGQEASTLVTNITLWAVTVDSEIESELLEILLIPNFFVKEEIYLDDNSHFGTLDITGVPIVLKQVTVEPADSSILFINKGQMLNSNTIRHRVQLIDYHWRLANIEDAMGVIVSSPLTKQQIRVMVKVSDQFEERLKCKKSPLFNFFSTYKPAIIITISMIVIFVLTYIFYSCNMRSNVNPKLCANQSLLVTPTSSTRSSPNVYCCDSRNSPNTCTNRFCTCQNRRPVYGDATTLNTSSTNSTERSRRFI